MKKNLFYAGMLLLGMTVATGCSNEETLEQVASNGKTIQAVIEKATEARTSVSDNYEVLWTTGDQFDVWSEAGKVGTLELKSGEGTTSASFGLPAGVDEFDVEEGMTAFFPSNEAGEKTYTFETSYTSQETDAPMLGTFTNGKFTFQLLTAMVRVVVTDVPQGTAVLTISSESVNFTGEASLSNGVLGLSNDGGKEVTVTISNNTESTLTFDVPVPALQYTGGLNVKLTVGNDVVFNKRTNGFTAAAGKIYVFGATYVSIDEGNVQETLQEALENGEAIILTGEEEEVSVPSLELPANTTATLDLNGKTLNLGSATAALVRSTSAEHGISNYGTLTINGGNIVFISEDINKAAIYNEGNITITNVEIETNARCFANHGTWTMGQDLAAHGTTPSVVATITDCKFNSTLTDHLTQGKHIYTVHGEYYSKITMKNTTINGHGGVSVDCSYAELENVTATHICTTGAHDLYVPCGNATLKNCIFSNAAAYSDDTYGKAVVNDVTYQNGTTAIQTWSEIDTSEELTAAFTNGGSYKLTANIEVTEALTATKPIALLMGDDVKLIIKNNEIQFGLTNKSNMTIKGGTINFTGNTTKNGAAVYNVGQIQLDDVDITSNNGCFINDGDDTKTKLDGLKAEDATVTAVINGGIFKSSFCKSESHTQHRYAVTGFWYSNLIMNGTTIEGSGGVCADVSFATLTNVNAEHACQYGAHDLYVPCGNATVTNCTFTNAAAYSDTTYGIAYVNGTPYTIPEGQTSVTTPINLNN